MAESEIAALDEGSDAKRAVIESLCTPKKVVN